jgi:MoaA/NifB/PqqE/SkfB family radical SAM enzyme
MLMISLDGTPETYKTMRGINAYYKVIETINLLKNKVDIRIGYTFSPWNNAEDYKHVIELCAEHNLGIGSSNIYTDEPYFKTDEPIIPIKDRYELEDIQDPLHKRFLELHDLWLEGKVSFPCFSIFKNVIIYPEGDVFFCHHRKVLLGNLHKQSLDEIWYSKRTIELQKEHIHCNGCWCGYHRCYDIAIEKLAKTLLHSKLLKHIFRL